MSEKIVSYSNLVTYNKELKKALGTSTSSDINYCYNQVAYYSQDNSTTNTVSTTASTTNIMGNLGVTCSRNATGLYYMGTYDDIAIKIEYTAEREDKIINWKGRIKVSDTIEWIKVQLPSQTINNVKYYCEAIYASITPNANGYSRNVVESIPYAHIINYDNSHGRGVYIRNCSYSSIETDSQYLCFDIRAVIKAVNVE